MNDWKEQLLQYLQNQSFLIRRLNSKSADWKYGGFEELLLFCGLVMEGQPMPTDIERGLPKNCYYNSQKIAFKNKQLAYVEGYAIAADVSFPLKHAWLMNPEGYAIDPTWETPALCYLGVPFNSLWLKSFLKLRNTKDNLSIFEGNYLEEYSLLKEGLPSDASFKYPSTTAMKMIENTD